jgi:hypothetical protein
VIGLLFCARPVSALATGAMLLRGGVIILVDSSLPPQPVIIDDASIESNNCFFMVYPY